MTLGFSEYCFACVVLVVSLFYLFLRNKYNYWKSRNVPFEKPRFIFGSLSFLMRKSFWDYFLGLSRRFPSSDYVGIYLGWKPVLVVQTPELARRILCKDFDHFQDRMCYSSYRSDPLGALNLFTVKNPVWSQIRHEISPMFTALRLKQVTEYMNGNARELVMKIKRDHVDRNLPVNLKELFSMYASDTVGSNVFGIKVSALNDPSSPLWYITSHMVKWTFWRGLEFSMIFYVPAVAAIMRLQFFSKAATEYITKLFWDVVNARNAEDGWKEGKDLVNHLVKLKENLKLPSDDTNITDDYMMAQAAVFILGSIETSSSTLCYCFHELAHHPEEQSSRDCSEGSLAASNMIYMMAQAAVFILGSIETSSSTLCYCFHELAHHPEEQSSRDCSEGSLAASNMIYMMAQAAVFILGSIETSSSTLCYCFHELAHHPEEQSSRDCSEGSLAASNMIYMMAQAAVFILGSIETSSSTLCYCFHELAHHPEEQDKLYQEISGAMKEKNKEMLDYEDLIELKYLTAVILETLRKFTPVQNLDRICTKRYQLTDDLVIEKGTPVFVNVMALHYDEKVFPEPEMWDPERMMATQETDNMQFSFLPFGDGPRFCIGKRYGVMQVRSALAQAIVHYKIEREPTEPYDVKSDPYSVFLAPLSGGRVRFTPRCS